MLLFVLLFGFATASSSILYFSPAFITSYYQVDVNGESTFNSWFDTYAASMRLDYYVGTKPYTVYCVNENHYVYDHSAQTCTLAGPCNVLQLTITNVTYITSPVSILGWQSSIVYADYQSYKDLRFSFAQNGDYITPIDAVDTTSGVYLQWYNFSPYDHLPDKSVFNLPYMCPV